MARVEPVTTGYEWRYVPARLIDRYRQLVSGVERMGKAALEAQLAAGHQTTEAAVKEEVAVSEPSVIISRRPCALLKYVKHRGPIKVDAEKCRTCRACMRIGCPAISIKDGKARIDATLCTGCGVCSQLCAFGAIGGEN